MKHLPTGDRMKRRGELDDERCCSCGAPLETDDHLFQCPKRRQFQRSILAVIDEISIELIAHIRDQTWHDLKIEGKDLPIGPWDSVIDFMTKEVKRTGRASGGGFYEYPKGKKKFLWPELNNYYPLSDNLLEEKEMIDIQKLGEKLAWKCNYDKVDKTPWSEAYDTCIV